jgi:small subunit ribosomal protein S13
MGVTRVKEPEKKEEKVEKIEKKAKKVEERKTAPKLVVRIANTDLDGNKQLAYALEGIKGIGYTMAKAICIASGLDPRRKLSTLSNEEIELIEKIIHNPKEYGIPLFLLNRRKDLETGKDLHLVGAELEVAKKFDIKRYIELKTYRGWRHMLGQPVRGQRTRSHFREKGKVVGVMKKAIKAKEEEEKKKKVSK